MVSEYFWRKKILRSEKLRKFVHVLVGLFVAFWPWWLSFNQIRLAALAMLAGVIVNKRLKLFHALNSVRRVTLGNIMFALGILFAATLTDEKIFFMIAILQLALADGAAAIVGQYLPKTGRYKFFGNNKTIYGTLAFLFVSVLVTGFGLMSLASQGLFDNYLTALLTLPIVLAFVENIAPKGTDNFFIPVTAIIILNLLS